MAERAKHAFGALENVDSAISSGKIDAFDILFVKDADGKPYVGWVDSKGQKVICDNQTDLSGVEAELATKANVGDVEALESQIATKANASDITELEAEVATKVDAATVKTMIDEATVGVIEVVEF
jgi:hypothetical protein